MCGDRYRKTIQNVNEGGTMNVDDYKNLIIKMLSETDCKKILIAVYTYVRVLLE